MTAFRFVTLVCDTCFAAFDPGTALTEADARADAAPRGWAEPSPGEDRCGKCAGTASVSTIADDLEFGVPVLIPAR